MYADDDLLLLSGIQHYVFCHRQWELIHIEQLWADNYLTADGSVFHERAHDNGLVEKRGNTLTVRSLYLKSSRLGITGQSDVIEFHKNPNGVGISYSEGKWLPLPIEYKRGKPKVDSSDLMQLCAQAICIEEMFGCSIDKGYLFYGRTNHRLAVDFSEDLRKETEKTIEDMHKAFNANTLYKPDKTAKCKSCSLKDLCLPEIFRMDSVGSYVKNAQGEGE